jgi:hypothetical protein
MKIFVPITVVCLLLLAATDARSQVIIKARMAGAADDVPPPPKSLADAYNLARSGDGNGVNTNQDYYLAAAARIDRLIASIEADSYKEEKTPDPSKMMKDAKAVNPEVQAAMQKFFARLQADEQFAARYEAMTEKQQEKCLQDFIVASGINLPEKPAASKATPATAKGGDVAILGQWMQECAKLNADIKARDYSKLISGLEYERQHHRLDSLEQKELNVVPIKKMGEYTGPDPVKTKEIHDRYFAQHIKLAETQLGNDVAKWNLYKSEILAAYGPFDKKLESLAWGEKISVTQMKVGIAATQRNMLQALYDLIQCDHKITYRAASWYAKYLSFHH